MTKKEILDYVMHTPYNTNRQILEGMLDNLDGTGSYKDITITVTNNKTSDAVEFTGAGLFTYNNQTTFGFLNFSIAVGGSATIKTIASEDIPSWFAIGCASPWQISSVNNNTEVFQGQHLLFTGDDIIVFTDVNEEV